MYLAKLFFGVIYSQYAYDCPTGTCSYNNSQLGLRLLTSYDVGNFPALLPLITKSCLPLRLEGKQS